MGWLNYQFWGRRHRPNDVDDLARNLLASGTINTSGSMSSPVTIPAGPGADDLVGIFEVYGSSPIYVHFRDAGAAAASGTGTHAAVDSQPRLLLREANGSVSVLVPSRGTLAAVDAAAFS